MSQKKMDLKFKVRLPKKKEWVSAAKGGVTSNPIYPWGGPYGISYNGNDLCNYRKLRPEEISYENNQINYRLNDNLHFAKEVGSYRSNDYGLNDMAGNVAEMIMEKGIAMGGSFLDGLPECTTESQQFYTESKGNIGFRPIIEYIGSPKLLDTE